MAIPINTTDDGKARTLIAGYGLKQGLLNSIGASGFGCTGVAEPIRAMNYELDSVNGNNEGIIGELDMPNNHDLVKRVYGDAGKAPTINSCSGGNREPKVFTMLPECFVVKEATQKGYTEIEGGAVRGLVNAELQDKEGKENDR